MKTLAGLVGAGIALAAGGALAHHGWGSYDAARTMTMTSPVERLAWTNPHVHVDLTHQGAKWEIVLAPPFRMEARGLSPALLKVGTAVTVVGYPSTREPNELRAERITVADKTYELR